MAIEFKKEEKEMLILLRKKLARAAILRKMRCTEAAYYRILGQLFDKTGTSTIRHLIAYERGIEDIRKASVIAKEEWNKIYRNGVTTMNDRETQLAWQHWLHAWELAQKKFIKDANNKAEDEDTDNEEQ